MRPAAPTTDRDLDGAAIWRAIIAAIEELQRGRLDGEPLN
jgi:hypothetical protein